MKQSTRRHLRLVQGGDAAMGPITRMKLYDRVPPLSPAKTAFLIFAKLTLLASVLYCIYR